MPDRIGFPAPQAESFSPESPENLEVSALKVSGFQSEIQAVSPESFSPESPENLEDSALKVSGKQEVENVQVKLSGERDPETFSNMDIEEFVRVLDVSALKTQMRNWYRRRLNTPENLAKYKAGRSRLLDLGIHVVEKTATTLAFNKKI